MPVSKPGTLPRWSEEAGGTQHNISPAPSSGRKDVGWLPDDEAIAQWFNWWMNLTYRWLAYLDDLENQALTWVGVQTFSARPVLNDGLLVNTPSTSNRSGIESTANGTGAGVVGNASATAGSKGVWGLAGDGNYAVIGSNGGNGSGGGFSSVSGYGLECSGNSTRAPFRIIPLSSAPSTAQEGDTYVDSTTHKLRVYLNGSWTDQT